MTSTLKSERSLFKCQFSLLPAKGDDKNNALFTVSIFQIFHTQKTEDSKNTHLLFSMKNFENWQIITVYIYDVHFGILYTHTF